MQVERILQKEQNDGAWTCSLSEGPVSGGRALGSDGLQADSSQSLE